MDFSSFTIFINNTFNKVYNYRRQGGPLTTIFSDSWYHHPGSDPGLQRERRGHGGPLQLLRVWLEKLREAGVYKGVVLASEGRQRIHGARVHSEETPLVQSSESWLGQVEELGFGQDSWLGWRGLCRVWMRGGSL